MNHLTLCGRQWSTAQQPALARGGRKDCKQHHSTTSCWVHCRRRNRHQPNGTFRLMNRSSGSPHDSGRLPITYKPSENDVIIGTGKEARDHIGNKNLINIVLPYCAVYSKSSKAEKSRLISQIIRDATIQSPLRTPFVRRTHNGHWCVVEDELLVREKVSQTMRNLLHSKYRSSTKAKKQRRMQSYQQFDAMVHSMMKTEGSFITARIQSLFAQIESNNRKPDDEVCELFTQANIDILESLKSLSLKSDNSNRR